MLVKQATRRIQIVRTSCGRNARTAIKILRKVLLRAWPLPPERLLRSEVTFSFLINLCRIQYMTNRFRMRPTSPHAIHTTLNWLGHDWVKQALCPPPDSEICPLKPPARMNRLFLPLDILWSVKWLCQTGAPVRELPTHVQPFIPHYNPIPFELGAEGANEILWM